MVEIANVCTARTLLLDALHADLIASALRVRADVLRNVHLDADAQTLEAAAALLETNALHTRSILPEHVARWMREIGEIQAAEEAKFRQHRAALGALPEPATSSSPPKTPSPAAKSPRRTKPAHAPKDRGSR